MNRPETNYVAEQIEKLLDEFTFDFQADVLNLALARLPLREADYQAEILRDECLGVLSEAITDSGLSFQEQSLALQEMRESFLRSNV